MTTRSRVVFTVSLLTVLSMLSLPAAAAPPRLAEEVVGEWLEVLEEAGVPGAIVRIETPYWRKTWARGSADLSTGRAIKAGDYFRIASISKTFTATVVLQLVEAGRFSLDDTLDRFNGGFGVPRANEITVRQLLNHTSGLGDWTESTEYTIANCSRSPTASLLVRWSPQSMVNQAVSVGGSPPGTGYEYQDTNYIILGMIAEWVLQSEVTGTRLPEEIRERILLPLSLDRTSYPLNSAIPQPAVHGYWTPGEFSDWCPGWSGYTSLSDGVSYDPSREFGCGAMISTAADLATWGRAYARGELISGELHRQQLTWGPWPAPSGGYGLGIMSLIGAVGHGGDFTSGYTSGMYYLPSRDAVIVVLLNDREVYNATFIAAQLILEIFPPAIPPRPTSGDYSGAGKSEFAIFRLESGLWAVRGLTRLYYGRPGDLPVPGDYDGDGTSAPAIFRTAEGLWAVKGLTRTYFGRWSDTPLPGDYDGSGLDGIAVFRPYSGLWAVRGLTRFYYGARFDLPLSGDFNGDGTWEAAVYRPESGLWALRSLTRFHYGRAGDIPVPGIYGAGGWGSFTGSSALQPAVFRPENGLWAVKGLTRFYHGRYGDIPVAADFNGDGLADPAVFRGETGLWAVRFLTRAYYGRGGDLPSTR